MSQEFQMVSAVLIVLAALAFLLQHWLGKAKPNTRLISTSDLVRKHKNKRKSDSNDA